MAKEKWGEEVSRLRDEEKVGLTPSPRQHLPWSQNGSRHLRLYTQLVSSFPPKDHMGAPERLVNN